METTMARDASLIGGIMISRKWLVAYWVATVFVAGTGAAAGTMDILRLEPFFGMLTRMGYPAYFSTILGIWKVLGAVALLVPGYPRLKEWAYAGMFIDYTAATASYLAVGAGGANNLMGPLMSMGFLVASWALRPPSRRLASV
jgi:uncharacterized membrane protein YphA (DoxX/SURF4 family)